MKLSLHFSHQTRHIAEKLATFVFGALALLAIAHSWPQTPPAELNNDWQDSLVVVSQEGKVCAVLVAKVSKKSSVLTSDNMRL